MSDFGMAVAAVLLDDALIVFVHLDIVGKIAGGERQ